VAATNRRLDDVVAEGRMRSDLLYRLLVFPIPLPPLRERLDDVPALCEEFLSRLGHREGVKKRLSRGAIEKILSHPWPGNVRELGNAIERAFILAPGDSIGAEHVRFDAMPAAESDSGLTFPVGTPLDHVEERLIRATLDVVGEKKKAARVLGISVKTLYNRMRQYGAAERRPSK
jgi:DNA-binding NtrC family response regulator